MTNKEAIEAINANYPPENYTTLREALDMAIVLLKEQEAKPVIVTTNAYGTRFYHCPICNFDLHVYPRQLYCSNCGQAVKWYDI